MIYNPAVMKSIELHAHSHFSFLDALASPAELVARAKELGYTALALTDHGGLFGIPHFLRAAEAAGIRPIVGCELYVSPTTRTDRSPDLRPAGHHLTVLAETTEGYANLAALSSAGYLEGFYYRPRVDRELLARHASGLIVLTGCIHSALCERLRSADTAGAENLISFYLEAFGKDHVFVEIQNHGLETEQELLEPLTALARRHRIRRVVTNDVHYLHSGDADAHRAAMDMRSRKLPSDPRRVRFANPAYHLRSADEWAAAFGDDFKDAFKTLEDIATRCAFPATRLRLNPYVDREASSAKRLKEQAARLAPSRVKSWPSPEYESRIALELDGIRSAGLSHYFLTVHNLTSEARNRGILIGPGRGSAAGSLLAFILGITEIDPVRYGLSFERFLSPARRTLPDIDIDVDYRERDRLVEVMGELDPDSRALRAGTFSSIGLKSAAGEVARAAGINYRDVAEKLAGLPAGATAMEPESVPPWSTLIPIINALAPLLRQPQTHHTAMVSVPVQMAGMLPLYSNMPGSSWIQFDGDSIEWMGIPKLDLLPIKILSVIRETVRQLKITGVADLSPSAIPLDDSATFQNISRGETTGIFQLESPGMRALLKEILPETIEMLAVALALYRPGPLEAGVPKAYVERKNQTMAADPPHPMFADILRETHGLVLYQEQVIACARMVGMSAAEADEFRVAVSKKDEAAHDRACAMLEKCLASAGLAGRAASGVVAQIAHHAGFAFNKAHAISYAVLTCRAAYLKTHHPAAFLAASANVSIDDRRQLADIFADARRLGIHVLPPEINVAGEICAADPDGSRIRLGLRMLRNVPEPLAAAILRARPFADIPDMLVKVPELCGSAQALDVLCKAGALDGFGMNRREVMAHMPAWTDRVRRSTTLGGFQAELFGDDAETPSASIPSPGSAHEPTPRELLFLEHEAIGCFATGSPMDEFRHVVAEFCDGTLTDLAGRGASPRDRHAPLVTAAGLMTSIRPWTDSSGREMAFTKLEDGTGFLEVTYFSDAYTRYKDVLKPGMPLLVRGRLEKRGLSVTLLASQVVAMDQPERLYESIRIKIDESVGFDGMKKLKEILGEHPGDRPVRIEMSEGGSLFEFLAGMDCRPCDALRRKIEALLGPYTIFFLKARDESTEA